MLNFHHLRMEKCKEKKAISHLLWKFLNALIFPQLDYRFISESVEMKEQHVRSGKTYSELN